MEKVKEIPNETLAAILRAICATGICPTEDEKAYLLEAAERLEDGRVDAEGEEA